MSACIASDCRVALIFKFCPVPVIFTFLLYPRSCVVAEKI
uniref:Uncharacterized protein n=1 Tax=Rhizophora mucronata TaxID=61149 RepID=A0A2P2N0N4_RHIMU